MYKNKFMHGIVNNIRLTRNLTSDKGVKDIKN